MKKLFYKFGCKPKNLGFFKLAYKFLTPVLISLLFFSSSSFAQPGPGTAAVNPPAGGFHIEGNLQANTPTAGIGDWLPGPAGAGGNVLTTAGVPINSGTTFHLTDLYGSNSDNNFAGGLKFDGNPNGWTWVKNPVGGKVDINNGLIHFTRSANGHQWVIVAADRAANTGDAYIDFEFLQKTVSTGTAPGPFVSAGLNGGRTENDFAITLLLTKGGTSAGFYVNRWQPVPVSSQAPDGYDYVDRSSSIPAGSVFASVNAASVPVSFGAFGGTSYATNTFAEAAVDLTALLSAFNPCTELGIKTILIKTKESASPSATIVDFISPLQVSLVLGVADAGPDDSHCSSTFNPIGSATPSPGSSVTSTVWSVLSGAATITNGNTLTPTVVVTSSPATLRLTVTTSVGCVVTDDVVLTVTPGTTTPTITSVAATCSAAGSSTISNYSASNTYVFTPSGPSVGTGGLIGGMTVGISYTVTSDNGTCASTASASFSNAAMLVTPATPTITPVAATCSAAGSSTISNYSASNTYVFSPSGPSVGTGGLIGGMTVGTSYTVTSNNGSCTSAASAPFSNAAMLAAPATPTITPAAATCSAAGSSTISNYSALNTYVFSPSGPSVGTGGLIGGMTVGTSYTVTSNNGSCTSAASAPFSNAAMLATPAAPTITSVPAACSAAGSSTISNYSASNTYAFTPSGPSVGTGGLISGMTVGTSYTVTSNNVSCTSAASAPFSNAANLASPIFKVCVTQPTLCSTGSLTINATGGTGFLYTIDGTDPTPSNTNNVFSNLGVGSVTTIKVKNSAGCSATPVNCADIVPDCSAPAARLANNTTTVKTADITEKQTTIKAYPNPFSDKVKFVVNATVSGTGNLEVYNTMGQKIKTVYAGLITAGAHTFELSLPVKNTSNLVYILRIGDKKMSGTLLQMNR